MTAPDPDVRRLEAMTDQLTTTRKLRELQRKTAEEVLPEPDPETVLADWLDLVGE